MPMCDFCKLLQRTWEDLAFHLASCHNQTVVKMRMSSGEIVPRTISFNGDSSGKVPFAVTCLCRKHIVGLHDFAAHLQEAGGIDAHVQQVIASMILDKVHSGEYDRAQQDKWRIGPISTGTGGAEKT